MQNSIRDESLVDFHFVKHYIDINLACKSTLSLALHQIHK